MSKNLTSFHQYLRYLDAPAYEPNFNLGFHARAAKLSTRHDTSVNICNLYEMKQFSFYVIIENIFVMINLHIMKKKRRQDTYHGCQHGM